MNLLNEIKIFFQTITDWILLMVIFTIFFFGFNLEKVSVFGKLPLLPAPGQPSFAADFFNMLVADLVPAGIPLIVTSPMAAFVVQIKLALLMAVFFTFPVFLYRLITYLAPALYKREQTLIYRLILPLTLLFFAGVTFAYVAIVPSTLHILYGFVAPLGAVPMLGMTEFVGIVMALLLTSGLAFTLPVFMVLLTAMGAVRSVFWLENSRYALVGFLIVSAIITPDGSGVSMLLLSAPVSLLYGAGVLVCSRVEQAGKKQNNITNLLSNNNK